MLMGDRIPETIEQALQLAGCQVNRLGGAGAALIESFAAAREAATAPPEAEAELPPAEVSAPGPATQKSLGHYVLFGPPGHSATLANLLLAQDYLLAFSPCFGFAAGEASVASMVTIVGNTAAVSQQVEDTLREGGAAVQRVSGSPGEVAAAFASRIAAGRPLV
jgi:hypothetical protein